MQRCWQSRVANITDFRIFRRSTEFRKWSVFLQIFIRRFEICEFFTDFEIFWFFSTFLIVIGNDYWFWPFSSWTANSDKKYMELNGAALNANNYMQFLSEFQVIFRKILTQFLEYLSIFKKILSFYQFLRELQENFILFLRRFHSVFIRKISRNFQENFLLFLSEFYAVIMKTLRNF